LKHISKQVPGQISHTFNSSIISKGIEYFFNGRETKVTVLFCEYSSTRYEEMELLASRLGGMIDMEFDNVRVIFIDNGYFSAEENVPVHKMETDLSDTSKGSTVHRALQFAFQVKDWNIKSGIASSSSKVGIYGKKFWKKITVMGNIEKTALSLLQISKIMSIDIVVCQSTFQILKEKEAINELDVALISREIDRFRITEKKMVYQIEAKDVKYDIIQGWASYEKGMREYRDKNFSAALIQFKRAMTQYDDGASKHMYERCHYIENENIRVPKNWDKLWPIEVE
jgi:hypothetical protein